jgi:hypothetical protein
MNSSYEPVDTRVERRRFPISLILIPLFAFIAGIAATGWLLSHWNGAASFVGIQPAAAPAQSRALLPQPQLQAGVAGAEPQKLLIDPEMTRRVTRLEQRLGEIDSQARQAVGNADRAEGLLVAFAARRALDRGVALGYIEGLLRQRFGDTQRQAVATIITASRQPVTLEELQDGLQRVGPALTGAGPGENWWTALKSELGTLVTIRKNGTPSPLPTARLERATRRLEAGQADVALAEVLRMPGRENAADWIDAARRYVAARRALDAIETTALLDPRNPPLQPVAGAPAAVPSPLDSLNPR